MTARPSHPYESGTLEKAFSLMQQASLKKTRGREALLRILIEKHGPFSVEELHSFLRLHKMDLVTVYRCLTSFERIGLVRRCDFGDGVGRFELQLDSEHHHHHIICRRCRKSENIDECEVYKLEKLIKDRGYSEITHNLEFFGICRQCLA